MKKNLIALIPLFLITLTISSLQAAPFWFDSMNYSVGNITTVAPNWIRHSGSLNDSLEVNTAAGHRYEVNQTRTDDVHRQFFANTNGFTAASGLSLYASFTINVTNLPANGGGTYFAHFMDNGSSFRGRIYVVTTGAYPGTWRLGVSTAAGDFTSTTFGSGPSGVITNDLALNTDYQVVIRLNLGTAVPTVWINPAAESDTANSASGTDAGAVTNAIASFAFRQSTGEGIEEFSNISVGTNFTDIATNVPALPVIGLQPVSITNYSGNPGALEVAASGIGVTYQWVHDSVPIPGATSQNYSIASLSSSDVGSYICVITNTAGSTNSATAYISVDSTPTAPIFSVQPQSRTNSVGSTATFTGAAAGTGPISYQWNFNGNPISDATNPDASVTSGSTTATLTISNVGTNEAGVYSLTVTGGAGSTPSTNATLTVTLPQQVSIAFLRTLQDNINYLATDTSSLWKVTGVITTFTNITTGSTASYYIQDATAGINLFVTGGLGIRPQQGDSITAIGALSSFNSTLELLVDTNNPYMSVVTNSHNNPLPAPIVFSPLITNNISFVEGFLEGADVMLTNVYFPSLTALSATANARVTVTNSSGVPFTLFFPNGVDVDSRGKVPPRFAWTVRGAMDQNTPNTSTPRNAGYEIIVTRFSDIVTNAPAAVTATQTYSNGTNVLSWIAQPYSYSYSVLAAADITGPFTPLVTGLTFTNAAGSYKDTNAAGAMKYYKIVSP